MKNHILLCIICFLAISYTQAQEKFVLKLNNHSRIAYNSSNDFDFLSYAPAIVFGKHEFELNQFNFSKEREFFGYADYMQGVDGADVERINIALRHQYNYFLFEKEESKNKTYLGLSSTLAYGHANWLPESLYRYPSRIDELALNLDFVLGYQRQVNEHMVLSIALPFQFAQAVFSRVDTRNPAVAEDLRVNSTLDFDASLPTYFKLIIGVGYRF